MQRLKSQQSFELNQKEIEEAIAKLPEQAIKDTDFCQQNVRDFAKVQLETRRPAILVEFG